MDGDKFFIIGRGEAVNRIDAFYWQPKFHTLDAIFARHPDWTVRLGSIATGITNGDHGGVEYTDSGVRYLRGQSVTEFGLDLAKDQRFISEAEHSRMVRAEVCPGDVLYTIAGSIGNACAVGGLDRANINQAIVRVRPLRHIIPQYLVDFLNSSLGRLQARRVANGGVQLNINFSEVRSLRILVPPLDKQRQLVDELAAARASHRLALAEAAQLLNSIDDYLLAELGITLPPEPANTLASRIFTAQRRELEQRFDPAYFSSRFSRIQHALETISHSRLHEVAIFSSEQWDQVSGFRDDFPYLEISAINTATGEVSGIDLIPKKNAPSRAKMLIREGDLLVSTTRPNRGAITLVDSCIQTPLIASTGFSVIRNIIESKISKEFLLILLRSRLCSMQLGMV